MMKNKVISVVLAVLIMACKANAGEAVMISPYACYPGERVQLAYLIPATLGTYREYPSDSGLTARTTALEDAYRRFLLVFTGRAPYDILMDLDANGAIDGGDWSALIARWRANPEAYQVGDLARLETWSTKRGNSYAMNECVEVETYPGFLDPGTDHANAAERGMPALYGTCVNSDGTTRWWDPTHDWHNARTVIWRGVCN